MMDCGDRFWKRRGVTEGALGLGALCLLVVRELYGTWYIARGTSSTSFDDRHRLLLPHHPLKLLHVLLLIARAPYIQPVLRRHILLHRPPFQRGDHIAPFHPLHQALVVRVPEIRQRPPRRVGLLPRGVRHPVHRAFQQPVGPLDHAVAQIDDRAARLRPHVLPVLLGVVVPDGQHLQATQDVEEGRHAAEVGVRDQARAAVLAGLRVVFEDADLVAGEPVEGVQGRHGAGRQAEVPFQVREHEQFELVVVDEEGGEEVARLVDDGGGGQVRREADQVVLADAVEFAAVRRPVRVDFAEAYGFVAAGETGLISFALWVGSDRDGMVVEAGCRSC